MIVVEIFILIFFLLGNIGWDKVGYTKYENYFCIIIKLYNFKLLCKPHTLQHACSVVYSGSASDMIRLFSVQFSLLELWSLEHLLEHRR